MALWPRSTMISGVKYFRVCPRAYFYSRVAVIDAETLIARPGGVRPIGVVVTIRRIDRGRGGDPFCVGA